MKLVIDIDEAIYKEIKEEVKAKVNTSSHIPFLHEVISVGKPLNKRLMGKWIMKNDYTFDCNLCGCSCLDKNNYCPDCGADMRGGDRE